MNFYLKDINYRDQPSTEKGSRYNTICLQLLKGDKPWLLQLGCEINSNDIGSVVMSCYDFDEYCNIAMYATLLWLLNNTKYFALFENFIHYEIVL